MIVLLCEDSQHESFVTRFLKTMGWETRQMRVEKSPLAKGSAEQWVRKRFCKELQACRTRNAKSRTVLITVIDGDGKMPEERIRELANECKEKDFPFRKAHDPAAIAVPCRNIETWIRYLDGEDVDEDQAYPKLEHERNCRQGVLYLSELCRTTGLPAQAPRALYMACEEYNQRIQSAVKH